MKISGLQIAAARGLLKLTQDELAEAADVTGATVRRFENDSHETKPETIEKLRVVLEARGIEFTNGDGIGVRLRYQTASETKPPAS